MDKLLHFKNIVNDLGYLEVYLSMYLINTRKKDNLENIQEYINNNFDVWLRNGSRM
tara:strand:+ start:379 stop:546 length:168 start_codon:yes stop_codon:yes gene_type:complete